MSFEVELKDGRRTLHVESDKQIPIESATVRKFVDDIDLMNSKVSLSTFLFAHDTTTSTAALFYRYEIIASDGRLWKQTILFQEGVTMTFNVNDRWSLDEFSLQRPLRDGVVAMVRDFGAKKVRCNYA